MENQDMWAFFIIVLLGYIAIKLNQIHKRLLMTNDILATAFKEELKRKFIEEIEERQREKASKEEEKNAIREVKELRKAEERAKYLAREKTIKDILAGKKP